MDSFSEFQDSQLFQILLVCMMIQIRFNSSFQIQETTQFRLNSPLRRGQFNSTHGFSISRMIQFNSIQNQGIESKSICESESICTPLPMIQSCLFCSSFCTKRHLPFSFFWTQWLNHCLRFVYTPAMNPSWTEAFTFLPSFNLQATWRAGDLNSLFSLGIGSVKQAARWFGISKKQRHSTDHICIRAVAS